LRAFLFMEEFLIDLKQYQFNLKSEKINSIARLVKLGIPTVPYPHGLLPSTFEFYLKDKTLPEPAIQQLKRVFQKIKKAGYNLTIRPSIFTPKSRAFEFVVPNNVNLPTVEDSLEAIISGYDRVIKKSNQLKLIEFAYLIQGFYTANKAGVLYSEDGLGNLHLEGVFGEHTRLITREGMTPDVYKINKKTGEVIEKQIVKKEFTLEPSKKGLRKVRLKKEERIKPVFTNQEIKKIYQYALRMEKEYGPQEIECAVLRTREVIFQSARDSQIRKQKLAPIATKNIPIFAGKVQGRIIFLRKVEKGEILIDKIVITDNLGIDFITKLTLNSKPKGVILTRGSLTAHAVTILREAKIPSVLARNLNLKNKECAEIKNGGEIILS